MHAPILLWYRMEELLVILWYTDVHFPSHNLAFDGPIFPIPNEHIWIGFTWHLVFRDASRHLALIILQKLSVASSTIQSFTWKLFPSDASMEHCSVASNLHMAIKYHVCHCTATSATHPYLVCSHVHQMAAANCQLQTDLAGGAASGTLHDLTLDHSVSQAAEWQPHLASLSATNTTSLRNNHV
jgi:hypothetical protein